MLFRTTNLQKTGWRVCKTRFSALFTPYEAVRNLRHPHSITRPITSSHHEEVVMAKKKKTNNTYNDFLDGEKLLDNADVKKTLQSATSLAREISPPLVQSTRSHGGAAGTQQESISEPIRSKRGGGGGGAGSQKKPPITHFLCLPITTPASLPQLRTSLSTLQSHLPTSCAIPASAVRPPSTLHLTLGVMSLDPSSLQTAIAYLQKLDLHGILRAVTTPHDDAANANEAVETGSRALDALIVNLQGLHAMHKPSSTSVLYAEARDKGHQTGRLEAFARSVREKFSKEGFLLEEDRELRLHVTLVNTIYAKKEILGRRNVKGRGIQRIEGDIARGANTNENPPRIENASGNTGPPSNTHTNTTPNHPKLTLRFDARPLIHQYQDFLWAQDVQIDRLCICEMGARKVWSGRSEGVGEVLDAVYDVVGEKEIGLG